MYTQILYTLQTPQQGRCLLGITQDRMQVLVTCPLTSVGRPENRGSGTIYRCVTRHGTPYLVYVLPPESDLSAGELSYLHALHRLGSRQQSAPPPPECSCPPGNEKSPGAESETAQLRKLLWWLGFLSVLLGSQSLFGEKLWSLFLEVARILLKP